MKKLITKLIGVYLNLLSIISPRSAGRLGVKIFCYPFRAQLKPHHKMFLDSSEKFEFQFDGIMLQGYKWGHGNKKVLFLHGWQSHTFRWKNYIQSLSPDDFTVYAFDAPGHGFSEGNFLSVPFYSQAIEQFVGQVGPIDTAISHSVGSFSLVYTLYRTPLLPVNKMILMAPPGEASDFIDSLRQTLNLSERAVQCALEHFRERFGNSINYFSAAKFASTLNIPGLIIHDEHDDETPFHYGRQINNAWRGSILVPTKGLGHNLKSDEVVKTVYNFVTSEKVAIDSKHSLIMQR